MTLSIENWTYNHLFLKEDSFQEARRQIYHSDGTGYIVIRNFLDPQQVTHLREIWSAPTAPRHFAKFLNKQQFYLGGPNFVNQDDKGNRAFYNFLWEKPLDELTYEITFFVQQLRSRLSGRNTSSEFFPTIGTSVSYRVVHTRNSAAPVTPHRDWWVPDNLLSKEHDLTRLQVTLMLSEHGKDYEGEGFALVTNQGKKVVFGVDEKVNPGDLILWRYSNIHSVMDVRSRPDQFGFLRILYPQEKLYKPSATFRFIQTIKSPKNLRIAISSQFPPGFKRRIKQLIGVDA